MDERKLRTWLQTYAVAWSGQGPDMQKIMLKDLDKVFEEKCVSSKNVEPEGVGK